MNPIEKLESDTIINLLASIKKQFRISTKNDIVTEDYRTGMWDIYNDIISYIVKNTDELLKKYVFTDNMDYGGWCVYMLKLQLDNRGIDK